MKIVVIGSGVAGITFAEQYRKLSAEDSITLLTQETEGYYSRQMLSRGFSKADIEETIVMKSFASLRDRQIDIKSGVEVCGIDCAEQAVKVVDKDGQSKFVEYDKLILATGSAAFIPPPLLPFQENFYLFNSLRDLIQLRRLRAQISVEQSPHWAVIGGGLIGCELASDLAEAGDQVTLYHAMDRLMERQLQETDSVKLFNVFTQAGVSVRFNQNVSAIVKEPGGVGVASGDERLSYHGVIVSCGFKPRTQLAEMANLKVNRGILVNQRLQTDHDNIFALGDVAELPNGKLYAFIAPILNQARWLANQFFDSSLEDWNPPSFLPRAKVHGFEAEHDTLF